MMETPDGVRGFPRRFVIVAGEARHLMWPAQWLLCAFFMRGASSKSASVPYRVETTPMHRP